ncbi:hypothetical protein [Ruegeria sp. HKCCA6837]|uniref:hypothetical protein n=1 Tax=Ruegeria sp. HKCCA6837 TaxID=2682989 RepID=UPI0014887644|nr:hypothetical protein [Ruegeria sp. HKCCA6837]
MHFTGPNAKSNTATLPDFSAVTDRLQKLVPFISLVFILTLASLLFSKDALSAEYRSNLIFVSENKKSRVASKIGPYSDKRRWQIYKKLDKEFNRLWDKRANPFAASVNTRTFRGFPYLLLEDRDRDGVADSYAYLKGKGNQDTQEFGAFWDLAGDGTLDWLVFYGGVTIAEGAKMSFWHRHLIDRNNDGKFDTLVVNNVDQDGNGMIEQGKTVWLYDANFDGRIDAAEHIVGGKVSKLQAENGRFDTKDPFSDTVRVGERFPTVFDQIASDIKKVKN